MASRHIGNSNRQPTKWGDIHQGCHPDKCHQSLAVHVGDTRHKVRPFHILLAAGQRQHSEVSEVKLRKIYKNSFHRPLLLAPYHWQQRMKWEFYLAILRDLFDFKTVPVSRYVHYTSIHMKFHPSTYVLLQRYVLLRGRDSTVMCKKQMGKLWKTQKKLLQSAFASCTPPLTAKQIEARVLFFVSVLISRLCECFRAWLLAVCVLVKVRQGSQNLGGLAVCAATVHCVTSLCQLLPNRVCLLY